jgi:tRNA(Ile)-lysidine synthase
MEFCNNKQIPYGIDETNELDIYERNRIRKALSNLTISQKDDEYQRIIQFNKDHEPQLSQVNKKYIL